MPETLIAPPDLNLPTVRIGCYTVPILDRPYSQILAAIEGGGDLDMSTWHNRSFCGSCHCIAGWTTHLCGQQGRALELAFGSFGEATEYAAEMILKQSSTLAVPRLVPYDYYSCGDEYKGDKRSINVRALDTIRALAAQEVTL